MNECAPELRTPRWWSLANLIASSFPSVSRLRTLLVRVALAIAATCAVIFVADLFRDAFNLDEISAGARWSASSASEGMPERGRLPQRGFPWSEPYYFFHTLKEKAPWLQIDLGAVRFVRSVEILNRLDCCYERAGRLLLDVGLDRHRFVNVARRAEVAHVARRWSARVRRKARFIRIRSRSDEPLHFADVRVFGQ